MRETNEFGVPYHRYDILLKDGFRLYVDVGDEDDWGNIQHCYTNWDGTTHRECVGWGSANECVEVVDVIDTETGEKIDPLKWANERVWIYTNKYSN